MNEKRATKSDVRAHDVQLEHSHSTCGEREHGPIMLLETYQIKRICKMYLRILSIQLLHNVMSCATSFFSIDSLNFAHSALFPPLPTFVCTTMLFSPVSVQNRHLPTNMRRQDLCLLAFVASGRFIAAVGIRKALTLSAT